MRLLHGDLGKRMGDAQGDPHGFACNAALAQSVHFYLRLWSVLVSAQLCHVDSHVLFSCKITHSLITYLDRRGEDLHLLYEKCDWPMEFLRDPSSWLEAEKMENLLRLIEGDFNRADTEEGLIASVGRQCKDIRAWGVLDSVLRMVQTPKDLFAQPERFLSYFISPAPPIAELKRADDSVSFVLPVSELQFPFVTTYLKSALEALPTYINKPMASVKWEESRVRISWSERQVSLFSETENTELSLHPELVRNILMNLESSQKELEAAKKALLEKDEEIAKFKQDHLALESHRSRLAYKEAGHGKTDQISNQSNVAVADQIASEVTGQLSGAFSATGETLVSVLARGVGDELARPSSSGLTELYRVADYLARGQQLITLLIGQGRQTPQIQEAMRRVDWNYVTVEGPAAVKRAIAELQFIQTVSSDLQDLGNLRSMESATKSISKIASSPSGLSVPDQPQRSNLNQLIERAIARAELQLLTKQEISHAYNGNLKPGSANRTPRIETEFLLEQELDVYPKWFERAVANLIVHACLSPLLAADSDSNPDSRAVAVQPDTTLRVTTRSSGTRAFVQIVEIAPAAEISPPTVSMHWPESESESEPEQEQEQEQENQPENTFPSGVALAEAIIRRHNGTLSISQGSRFSRDLASAVGGSMARARVLIELPLT